eukprot:578834-Ditylum_brightwellii.AAC.1
MAKGPVPLLEDSNAKLIKLDDKIFCEHYCTTGGFSMGDIDLWACLCSITIISGVQLSTKLRGYMDNLSELGNVPLYNDMAL